MSTKKLKVLETWIGGYLGPSYRVELQDGEIIYEVYERGYELHSSERLRPSEANWARFVSSVRKLSVWDWDERYTGTDGPDGTTWYVVMADTRHKVVSRGLNAYPPGFIDYLRSVRLLIEGRQFS
jgi:hypothetical protein